MSEQDAMNAEGKPRNEGASGFSVPVVVFALAVIVAAAVAVYQIIVAGAQMSLEGGEVTRVPLSLGQSLAAVSFVAWPLLAVWGAWHKISGVAWVATGVYLVLSFGMVFSFGGAHLVFGGPVMLLGAIWSSVLMDRKYRDDKAGSQTPNESS